MLQVIYSTHITLKVSGYMVTVEDTDGNKRSRDNLPTIDIAVETAKTLQAELLGSADDAMIAHRWFAKHFGEIMNGRDFAVKCQIADQMIADLKTDTLTLLQRVVERDGCRCDTSVCDWCKTEGWAQVSPETIKLVKEEIKGLKSGNQYQCLIPEKLRY